MLTCEDFVTDLKIKVYLQSSDKLKGDEFEVSLTFTYLRASSGFIKHRRYERRRHGYQYYRNSQATRLRSTCRRTRIQACTSRRGLVLILRFIEFYYVYANHMLTLMISLRVNKSSGFLTFVLKQLFCRYTIYQLINNRFLSRFKMKDLTSTESLGSAEFDDEADVIGCLPTVFSPAHRQEINSCVESLPDCIRTGDINNIEVIAISYCICLIFRIIWNDIVNC